MLNRISAKRKTSTKKFNCLELNCIGGKSLIVNFSLVMVSVFLPQITFSQVPQMQWQKTYGGSDQENFYAIEPAIDYGYLLIGDTRSTDADVHDPPGGINSWIVKIDSIGGIQWENAIGGTDDDHSYSAFSNPDGSYTIGVESLSDDGDSPGNYGGYDFLYIKLDASGNVVWAKNYGGSLHDHPSCVRPTNDGGLILGGGSRSNNHDISGHHGDSTSFDVWIMKLDTAGEIVWSKSIGGTASDFGLYIEQLNDGNYVLVGQSQSDDGDITGHHGDIPNDDLLAIKFDSAGNIIWQKLFGGSKDDIAHHFVETSDGGFMIVGSTASADGDVTANHGGDDFWVLRLDSVGDLLWQKTYGGLKSETGRDIEPTINGGFIICGQSFSSDGDVTNAFGATDYWLISIDSIGDTLWQESLGGSAFDYGKSILITQDENFLVAGNTNSTDGQVTGNHGNNDFWLVKLSCTGQFYYADADGDGYGNPNGSVSACLIPAQYVLNDSDCDDFNPSVYPGALEIPGNSLDDDCDGTIDEVAVGDISLNEMPSSLSVFPNPANKVFTICLKSNDKNDNVKIELINPLGQVLSSEIERINGGELVKEIHHSSEVPGMYLIQVTTNEHLYSTQITIQK